MALLHTLTSLTKDIYHKKEKTMNDIANITQVLRKYPGHSAHTALNSELGQNSDLIQWMYCGWGNSRLGLTTSPLANPYSSRPNARSERIKVDSRDEAVERYREWLWAQLRAKNQAVIEALISVEPRTTLVCWCAPKRCHCEVIAAAVQWLWESEEGIDLIFS